MQVFKHLNLTRVQDYFNAGIFIQITKTETKIEQGFDFSPCEEIKNDKSISIFIPMIDTLRINR